MCESKQVRQHSHVCTLYNGIVSLSFSNQATTAADLIAVMLQEYRVRDLTIADPKIETIVQEIYERGV